MIEQKNLVSNKYEELIIKSFLEFLKEKGNIDSSELFKQINKNDQLLIPCSIFNEKLGSLESIVKYMKEEKEFDYNKIASLLFRKSGPIGITYRNANKKHPEKLFIDSKYFIPIEIFSNTKLSVLENITYYLKNNSLKLHQIAILLHRDDRTIWTTYQKALKKLNLKKGEINEKK